MLVQINVTQDDIRIGKRRDCRKCPVAQAITRKLDPRYYTFVMSLRLGILLVEVGSSHSPIVFSSSIHHYVYYFINLYDMGKPVQPITFSMDIPSPLLLQTLVEGNLP